MTTKTEYGYNEDDFVEVDGAMNELTVTITLCEYRSLISEQVRAEDTITRLNEEKEELEKALKSAKDLIAVCKLPEWIREFGTALSHWGEDNGEEKEHDGEGVQEPEV